MADYDTGDLIRLTATFTDADGVLANPTTVVLTLRHPDGTTTTPPITPSTVGVYYADVLPAVRGRYDYRWEGTGAVQQAEEGHFYAKRSRVAP